MSGDKEKKKKIQRSPGYPMISLDEAVDRIRILWKQEGTSPMHREVAIQHLGYEYWGGYSARIIAAMKKFGLISTDGHDIKLTKEAVDLVLHEETDEEYINTIQKIALKPTIYETLWAQYRGRLPSDVNLKSKLINEFGFNAGKVDDFIEKLRRTISYANLDKDEFREQQTPPKQKEKAVIHGSAAATLPAMKAVGSASISSAQKEYAVTLESSEDIQLVLPKIPIKKSDVQRLKSFIDLMAPVWTKGILEDTEE